MQYQGLAWFHSVFPDDIVTTPKVLETVKSETLQYRWLIGKILQQTVLIMRQISLLLFCFLVLLSTLLKHMFRLQLLQFAIVPFTQRVSGQQSDPSQLNSFFVIFFFYKNKFFSRQHKFKFWGFGKDLPVIDFHSIFKCIFFLIILCFWK